MAAVGGRLTWAITAGSVGMLGGALLSGWRWMFLIGGALPLPAVFLMRRFVPESPRWLAASGDTRRALAVLAEIERRVTERTGEPLPEPEPVAEAGRARGTWRELFAARYRRRTFVLWALWFCSYFVVYGIASWLPTIYRTAYHLSLRASLTYSMLGIAAAVVGSVVIALVTDRIGRRPSLTIALLAGGALLMALGATGAHGPLRVALWSSAAGIFSNAANIGLYLYTPELYPTRIRGLGCSLAGVWNRLGVIIGPVVIGSVYAAGHLGSVFVVLGGVSLAGALVAGLAAEETARRPLEVISP